MKLNPLVAIGGLGLLALLFGCGSSGINPAAKPVPTPTDGGGCGYPRTALPPGIAKTNAELQDRLWRVIVTTPRSEERGFSVLTGLPLQCPSPQAPSEP